MEITAKQIQALRSRTGIGIMKCKEALKETQGDIDKAVDLLRKRGMADAAKKMGRSAKEGLIGQYIHTNGKIGVLIEVNCESDFVARTEDFQQLLKDLCLQIASMRPRFVSPEDVPADILAKEKEIYLAQMAESGKPEHILEKIVEGKLRKYYEQVCLLQQVYVRDDKKKIEDLINGMVSKLGEKISVRRFARFEVGEELEG